MVVFRRVFPGIARASPGSVRAYCFNPCPPAIPTLPYHKELPCDLSPARSAVRMNPQMSGSHCSMAGGQAARQAMLYSGSSRCMTHPAALAAHRSQYAPRRVERTSGKQAERFPARLPGGSEIDLGPQPKQVAVCCRSGRSAGNGMNVIEHHLCIGIPVPVDPGRVICQCASSNGRIVQVEK